MQHYPETIVNTPSIRFVSVTSIKRWGAKAGRRGQGGTNHAHGDQNFEQEAAEGDAEYDHADDEQACNADRHVQLQQAAQKQGHYYQANQYRAEYRHADRKAMQVHTPHQISLFTVNGWFVWR